MALKLYKLTAVTLSHEALTNQHRPLLFTWRSQVKVRISQPQTLTPLSTAKCSRALPYCESAKSCAKYRCVCFHCHQELDFVSFLYVYSSGKKKKKIIKISKPWKTTWEATWICLEVYSLDFDTTAFIQFSQLCSRLAVEKGIILSYRFFLD